MTANQAWFLGIDLGTSSCKCALIDNQSNLLALVNVPYPDTASKTDWKTQNPESIYRGLIQAVQRGVDQAGVSPRKCQAVSIGCALHGLLVLDAQGDPLTPIMTWADDRAAAQAAAVAGTPQGRDLYQQTGCPPHGMYPLYKIRWLQDQQSALFNQAARLVSVKEYLIARLAGEFMVDYSLASGTGLLDVHSLEWHAGALRAAGVGEGQLSPLVGPGTRLKINQADFLEKTGLPPDLPLVLGSSDAVNSNLGAGAVRPTQATCMIGTSGAYRILAPEPILSPDASTWCYCLDEQHWLVGGAINNGGLSLAWFKGMLESWPEVNQEITIPGLLTLAEQSPAGSLGLICLPLFSGERSPGWNLQARGTFFGISMEHDLRHLSRSLLEGIGYRLRILDETLRVISGDIDEVRASGGFTRSSFWTQLTCDILNRPLSVPRIGDTSAFGAALWALLGVDENLTLQELGSRAALETHYHPQADQVKLYDQIFPLTKQLYTAVNPLFSPVHELREKNQDPPPQPPG